MAARHPRGARAGASVEGTTISLGVESNEVAAQVSQAVVRGGYCLYALVPSHQSLEDLFLSLVSSSDAG